MLSKGFRSIILFILCILLVIQCAPTPGHQGSSMKAPPATKADWVGGPLEQSLLAKGNEKELNDIMSLFTKDLQLQDFLERKPEQSGNENGGIYLFTKNFNGHKAKDLLLKVAMYPQPGTSEVAEINALQTIGQFVAAGYSKVSSSTQAKPVIVMKRMPGVHISEIDGWNTLDAATREKMKSKATELTLKALADYAVKHGLLHIDNSEDNILVSASGKQVKSVAIIDWGGNGVDIVTRRPTKDEAMAWAKEHGPRW